jgi:hypothetical protein
VGGGGGGRVLAGSAYGSRSDGVSRRHGRMGSAGGGGGWRQPV